MRLSADRRTRPGRPTRERPGDRQAFAAAAALEATLCDEIRGEVRFDAGSRALYATDASNYRQVPIGVVVPADTEDVVRTVAACRRFGAPLLTRGGGTSLAGQCCNVAVVLDTTKHVNRILQVDPDRRVARVQPGVVLDDLRRAARPHGLTFGPDPATHTHCTLGGMAGNNSCGVHSVMSDLYGPGARTSDNIEALEILTYDGLRMRVGATSDEELRSIVRAGGRRGEIYARLETLRDRYAARIRQRFPQIPRRVSGYGLDELLPENGFNVARALVGTEGTCVTFLDLTATLIPDPPGRALVVLGYPSVYEAADHIPGVMEHRPIGCEGFDAKLVGFMKKKGLHPEDVGLLPSGEGWLLVELGGEDRAEAVERAQELVHDLQSEPNAPVAKVYDTRAQEARIWEIRESGLGATAFVPGLADTWPGWEDSAVPPARLGEYLRAFRDLLERYDYGQASLYGHFGQGCVHTRIPFDLTTDRGIRTYRAFVEEAADLVVGLGGTLSGEHGDGQARGELLEKMYGDELVSAFREFKAIWDPEGRMNPGKVVAPARLDQHLRLGTDYDPPHPPTYFQFPEDEGSFARAALRCVGVGKCRRTEGGTMCPSYMVTREERHATRGRAHLLFEMLQGEVITDGWQSEEVKEALDLCLACKGCKGDCPVDVDMATYKAEFLSHYYEGHRRPRQAYAFGLIPWWARLASLAPGAVNLVTQTPGLATLAKLAANMPLERRIPRFAGQTFKTWFGRRPKRHQGRSRVILWPDTFNNHFFPQTLVAATEVLEDAGFHVVLPRHPLCCGRPLYDYGMLETARRLLRTILATLGPEIAAGTPVVGLEPSCVSVFRDELVNLFPHDLDAKRLSEQTLTLGEFLRARAPDYQPATFDFRRAIVQGHCHHKAIMKLDAEEAVLDRLGLDYEVLDSGCCGMAGAFGFEADKYAVSIQSGERVLLPAVRGAARETLVIADGFSCREQIAQTTGRRALHLAEAMRLAMAHGRSLPGDEPPERVYLRLVPRELRPRTAALPAVAALGAVAGGAALLWAARRP